MILPKTRLTVTVDPDWVRAARDAVKSRTVSSLSAWVNLALEERAAKDRRLRALGEAVSAYEAAFGEITPEEIERQARADRAAALVLRGQNVAPGQGRAGRRRAGRSRSV